MRALATVLMAAVLAMAPVLPAAAQEAPATPAPTLPPPIATKPVPNPTPAAPRPKIVRTPTADPAPATVPAAAPYVPTPTLPSGARLAAGQPIPPAELEAYVDGLVKSVMARDHIAGATVSVVQNGQVVLKKGYGFADVSTGRRVDPDRTLFRIGSVSKTFTYIALMREVEAGRIRLDAPVNLYLPQRLQVRDHGFEQEVRVRHLLDHSAGFEDRALGQLFERDAARVRPLAVYLQQERPRRVAAPGVRSSYSNYAVGLAGAAAAHVAQRPFERLIEERITVPLAMANTTFREPRPAMNGLPAPMPPAMAQHVSQAYRWAPAGFEKRPFEFVGQIAPAGSASSTAGDMARYMLMLLNGGTLDGAIVFSPRTAQAFRTPLRQAPAGINGWPHGFIQYGLPGGLVGYGHDGATLSFMTSMVVVPQLGLGVFVSTNTESGGRLSGELAPQLVQQFYAPPPPPQPAGSPQLADQGGRFTGHYLASRRASSGLEGFVGRLASGIGVQVTPAGRLVLNSMFSPEPQIFVPEGDVSEGRFVSLNGRDRLAFRFADGEAVSALTGLNAARLERAGFLEQPSVLMLTALLAVLAALVTLVGIVRRLRREHRESLVQSRASLIQSTQAVLWLAAIVLFGVWASRTGDTLAFFYDFPGPILILASACALLAAVLTAVTVVLTPIVWQGGRRVDSWSPYRKLAFTVTTLIYLAFSIVLFDWGALTPWS